MKKILSVLFLLSSPALAIDKPIPCDGANCKLKFETRDGSNVKVSAGVFDGVGKLGVGTMSPSSYFTDSNGVTVKSTTGNAGISIIANTASDKSVVSFGYTTGTNAGDGSNRGKIWYDFSADSLNFGAGGGLYASPMGTLSSAGAWTIGQTSATITHSINGKLRTIERGIEISGASAQGVYAGIYQSAVNPASTVSCTTECQNTDGTNGFGATSGLCLAAWLGATVTTCADATNAVKYCMCAGSN
jgi:hypothetical protein